MLIKYEDQHNPFFLPNLKEIDNSSRRRINTDSELYVWFPASERHEGEERFEGYLKTIRLTRGIIKVDDGPLTPIQSYIRIDLRRLH